METTDFSETMEIFLSQIFLKMHNSFVKAIRNQLMARILMAMDILIFISIISGRGTTEPFFSPDGEWIGFARQNRLNKISIRGGQPQPLAESMRLGAGGVWGSDETLFYSSEEDDGIRLQRLPATGGVPEPLEADGSNSSGHTWPWLLPGEKELMFTSLPPGGLARDGHIDLLTISTGI